MSVNRSHAEQLTSKISEAIGQVLRYRTTAGANQGDIDQTFKLSTDHFSFFVKFGPADSRAQAHRAELIALQEIAAVQAVRVPRPIVVCQLDGVSYLVLEWLDLQPRTVEGDRELGRGLARLHRCVQSNFGWRHDNWIGTTSQPNPIETSWPEFWFTHRLDYQLQRLNDARCSALGAELKSQVNFFFPEGLCVQASLGSW